jgi:hypothetical protein
MITEKDIKVLRSQSSKYRVFALRFIIPLWALILLAVALFNIYLAMKCAENGGTTLKHILRFEYDLQYSGWCMKSLDRLHVSLFQIAISVILFEICFGVKAEIDRSKRLLDFIEMHTNSNKSNNSNQSLEKDGLEGHP